MVTLSRIVVPVDFSESSELALSFARDLARKFGAALHLVHVVEDADAPMRLAQTGSQRRAGDRLRAMLTAEDRDLRARCAVVSSGLPAFAIVEYAKNVNAGAIVIAMRDGAAPPGPFLGFATERILRTAPCPVFVLRDREHRAPSMETRLNAAGAAAADRPSSSLTER
jgi:nucleotide-binding universal stress UspA family protein